MCCFVHIRCLPLCCFLLHGITQRVTFLEGAAGPLALMAVLLHESGNPQWTSHLDTLLAMANQVKSRRQS
jgi:hypothetical protein